MATRPLQIMETALNQKNAKIHSLEHALNLLKEHMGIDDTYQDAQCPKCDETGMFKVYSTTSHLETGEPIPTAIQCICGEIVLLCAYCLKPNINDDFFIFDTCQECHEAHKEPEEANWEITPQPGHYHEI